MMDKSWFDLGHVLYIDNPVGVGFSYGDSYVHTLDEGGSDFYSFLTQFYEQFPELVDSPLYLTG